MNEQEILRLGESKRLVHEDIWNVYKSEGISAGMQKAKEMYGRGIHNLRAGQVNGEICEVVCGILLEDLKEKGFPIIYRNSVIVPDVKTKSRSFLTEIDYVVMTPYWVYAIECKSYFGDNKTITDKGELHGEKHSVNVYKQNNNHLQVLAHICKPWRLKGKPARVQSVMFQFAGGTTLDLRNNSDKRKMQYVDERGLQRLITHGTDVVWDINNADILFAKLTEFSSKNKVKHMKYVTGGK